MRNEVGLSMRGPARRRRYAVTAVAVATCTVLLAGGSTPASAAHQSAVSAGAWRTAKQVPGTGKGGGAAIDSVSCPSAGNCGAGGTYTDPSGHGQAFVVAQTSGRWGTAEESPGIAALDKGGAAAVGVISCASAANCSAGGSYTDGSGREKVFVAVERSGTWGAAEQVRGTAALSTGGNANVDSMSCASAGDCSAGGYYTDSSGRLHAFVVGETSGHWGTAQVPGTVTLNHGDAIVLSVSCASAGNCAAGGWYTDSSGHKQAFVAGETSGRWGTAEQVPGTAALNKGGDAGISSVSCAPAAGCSAGGWYTDGSGHQQAFVVVKASGRWGTAEEVPGTAALNGNGASVDAVSCASAANCSAGGFYGDGTGRVQLFVVGEVSGRWGTAETVPGIVALNQGGGALMTSLSCGSAGNCSAGGYYDDTSQHHQAFVVDETSGRWGTAEEVPGTATLNKGRFAEVSSVSCASATSCAAGGDYTDSSQNVQAFTAGKT